MVDGDVLDTGAGGKGEFVALMADAVEIIHTAHTPIHALLPQTYACALIFIADALEAVIFEFVEVAGGVGRDGGGRERRGSEGRSKVLGSGYAGPAIGWHDCISAPRPRFASVSPLTLLSSLAFLANAARDTCCDLPRLLPIFSESAFRSLGATRVLVTVGGEVESRSGVDEDAPASLTRTFTLHDLGLKVAIEIGEWDKYKAR
ncbi:hypothetical protein AB1N83_005309 [Pleurotus pulmonarius]